MERSIRQIADEMISRLHLYRAMGIDLWDVHLCEPGVSVPQAVPRMQPQDAVSGVSAQSEILPLPSETGPLQSIREEIGDCKRCRLCEGRTHIVFGVGDPCATLMFIGEGPGEEEDRQGLPFVGRAGQLLTKMIAAMGKTREAVYIANIVKCRPPNNRNPQPDEIAACRPFLMQQISAIRPKIICTLGAFATKTLLETEQAISSLRGRFHRLGDIQVMPTYHPAYLLRNPAAKKEVWEDLQKVIPFL